MTSVASCFQGHLHSSIGLKQGSAGAVFHAHSIFLVFTKVVSREVLPVYLCTSVCIYLPIRRTTIISLACLSDVLVPFQAIKNEVKRFSRKRKEIKTGIKALAKTVSGANS